MLKNIKLYIVLFITLSFIACSSDNEVAPLFDGDIDSRVERQLTSYRNTLVNSEFGWKLVYQPNNSIGFYNIFLDFNADGTVEIVSDFDLGAQDLETTFRVGKAHFPELVFENYSTFHNLFELNNFVLEAEFEFIFEEVTDDQIVFRSKTDNGDDITKIVFEKAVAGEKERVIETRGTYDQIAIGNATTSFLRNIIVTDPSADATAPPLFQGTFAYSEFERLGIITTFDQATGNISSTTYTLAANDTGFLLTSPLLVNGVDIANFNFNDTNNTFTSDDGGLNAIIGYDLAPVATGLIPSFFSTDADTFDTRFARYLYFDDSSQFYLRSTAPDFLNLIKSVGAFGLDIRMNQFGDGVHGITFRGVAPGGAELITAFSFTEIAGERIVLNYLGATGPIDDVTSAVLLLADPAGWYIQQTNESPFAGNPSFQLTSVSFPNFRFPVYGL